jgi:hypothetical protein
MCARGRKFGVKTGPQIFLAQNLIFFNGSMAFRYLQRLSNFHKIRENILQQLSDFFNGFLLSSTAFCFLQWLSDFPQRLSTFQEIRENLSMAASIRKIAIRALYFSQNCDIPQ